MLKAIGGKVGGRECRDQLFQTLDRNGSLEFSEGLFVRNGWSTFYVSNDGDVQRLCYSKKVEMREAVLKADNKGKLPTKLEEVTEDHTLKRIADIVGKTRPELTLLIIP
jgi:ribosomal protein L24E